MSKKKNTIVNIDKLIGIDVDNTGAHWKWPDYSNTNSFQQASMHRQQQKMLEHDEYAKKVNDIIDNSPYKVGDKVYYYSKYVYVGSIGLPTSTENLGQIKFDEDSLTTGIIQKVYWANGLLGVYIDNNPYNIDCVKGLVTKVKKKKLSI